jgi:hypothetical protein
LESAPLITKAGVLLLLTIPKNSVGKTGSDLKVFAGEESERLERASMLAMLPRNFTIRIRPQPRSFLRGGRALHHADDREEGFTLAQKRASRFRFATLMERRWSVQENPLSAFEAGLLSLLVLAIGFTGPESPPVVANYSGCLSGNPGMGKPGL